MKTTMTVLALAACLCGPVAMAQDRPPRDRPPRGGAPRDAAQRYSLEQAVSDQAQLHTIAFDGLAFLTGDFGYDTFLPPGKVSDYFGFQYMRDIDAGEGGHNTSFLTRIAHNMLAVLDDAQKARLLALGREQEGDIRLFAEKRFPLIRAFRRNLEGDVPAGSRGLDRDAVVKYSADLYELDGRLSCGRAKVMGEILHGLSDGQKAALARLKFGDSRTWPDVPEPLDRRSMSHEVTVAVMTYASEMFAWYAGSLEADTYFCPERHGMYFGGFGMKTAPAMGKQDYSISTTLTGDSGEAFLAALTEAQRKSVTDLVDLQRKDLAEIVRTRRAIATELRRFLKGEAADGEKVGSLSRRYGELDGEMSYLYATAFAAVGRSLTAEQKARLQSLRRVDPSEPRGPFLYSAPIRMPAIPDTDFLFGVQRRSGESGAAPDPAPEPAPSPVPEPAPAPSGGRSFVLRSPEVGADGRLPRDCTGEGSASTLPLEWSGAPDGTKSFAVIVHHVAPDRVKWYWVLYGIPGDAKGLPKNVRGIGTLGINSVNGRAEYAPPHSRGPGPKTYVFTLYALSAPPRIDVEPSKVGRDELLAAMKGLVLGTAELGLVYSRSEEAGGDGDRGGDPPPPPGEGR